MSLRVWGHIDIHKCIHFVKFCMNDVAYGLDPAVLPSGFLEVVDFVVGVKNWEEF